jgi:hypothetical protein
VSVVLVEQGDSRIGRLRTDPFMWGSDNTDDESADPQTSGGSRRARFGAPRDEIQKLLGGNAAAVDGFETECLAELAAWSTSAELSVRDAGLPVGNRPPAHTRP